LVIRFFYTDTFGEIEERVKKHYCDIYVDGMRFQVSPYRILLETAVGRESGNVASNLSGALMQSILNGSSYPFSLYQALLRRIRAEGGKDPQKAKGYAINAIRVGVLKGYLNRIDRLNQKKERINVALNLEERDVAYVLGRLFALLEKAQKDALGEVNASIVDKYLNSALATPQMVFPMLLALSKTHTSKTDKKSEGKNYGRYTDRRIAEVVDLLPSSGFPVNLNAEQQGRFIIGYYHQNQALYAKKIKEGQVEVSNEKEEM
jgi:CRISPR-associated protein Csd1